MAINAPPQNFSYISGEKKKEAGLHGREEIPVALIDKYLYLVLGESFADVKELNGVVSGALQYTEDVVLDVWSFNKYHDGTEKVPLVDTLFSGFAPEKFVNGIIVTNDEFWEKYQNGDEYLLSNIFETMDQIPVILHNSNEGINANKQGGVLSIYFNDEDIAEFLPPGELNDMIYRAYQYALDSKELA